MKYLFKLLIFGIVVGLGVYWYVRTPGQINDEKTLIVGTSADYPPFCFRGHNDELVGFDIALIKEVARRLSIPVSIQDKPFSTLLPQLELGQIHLIAAGMSPTPERAQRVTFTRPYHVGNSLLIVTRKNGPSFALVKELEGKQVLVNTGYTADHYLTPLVNAQIVRLPKVADAVEALERGKADAFVTAALTLQPYLKDRPDRFVMTPILGTDEKIALGISKKVSEERVEAIQKALDAMEQDGTLASLKTTWGVV